MAWLVPAIGMAGGIAGGIAQGHSAAKAAREQEQAAKDALAAQTGLIEGAQTDVSAAGAAARGAYEGYGEDALGTLGQGFEYIDQATGAAASAIGSGLQDASSTLGGLGGLGLGFVPSATTSVADLGTRSRLGEMFEGTFDLQSDPGYQARLAAGEQAINRKASAGGGRFSGATMKALQAHGQDLASQEYGAAFNRQAGLASGADQFGLQAALAAQRNQMGLAGMGFGAMQNMAGMQYGAGQDLAGIYGSQGQQQVGLLGQQAGVQTGMGSAVGGTYTDAANTNAALTGQLVGAQTGPVNLAGGEAAAWANAFGVLGGIGSNAGTGLSSAVASGLG